MSERSKKSLSLNLSTSSIMNLNFQQCLTARNRNETSMDNGVCEPLQGVDSEQNGRGNHPDPNVNHVNIGQEDQMEVYGYKKDKLKTSVSWLLIVLSGGSLRLVFHWWPQLMLYATHRQCALDIADKVLLVESYQETHKCYYVRVIKLLTSKSIINETEDNNNCSEDIRKELAKNVESAKLSVHSSAGEFKEMDEVRVFDCKKLRYVWDPELRHFYKMCGLGQHMSTSQLHDARGLSSVQQYLRRVVYGKNEIAVPMKSILSLLFLEVLNPFYVFQVFSFALWFADDYTSYAMAIAAMSVFSITGAIIQTRKNQRNLRSTVHISDNASIYRNGEVVSSVSTELLVPGDILVIPPHGCVMHCDAVLLAGNCIVNESMLTGESVPVTKTPLPNDTNTLYDNKEHARHTLYCGTQVIQTRYYGNHNVYAVVISTGFNTSKGSLVRSILYPPPVDFKFEQDSYKFVQLLALIASLGFLYTVVTKYMRGFSFGDIALEALDLITIVVPPALPAAMTVGRIYAQNRLQKNNIYCISPRTINVSGSINCVCFDKTGTLTEDGLDMWGVVPVHECKFLSPVKRPSSLASSEPLLAAMVTCHSLTIISHKLSGDPLDLKMFESTEWHLEEPNVNDESKFDLMIPTVVKPNKDKSDFEIGVIRQFPFSSTLQRMSVITRTLGENHFNVFCKGSPEMMHSLCLPESVPSDFNSILQAYTQEGYRVLAVGYRPLPIKMNYVKIQRLSREEVESSLTFLGLVVLENRLKPESTGVLETLKKANIRTIMVTGDNMLTAVSVARDCEMVSTGQKVITVHGIHQPPALPHVFYTLADSPQPLSGNNLSSVPEGNVIRSEFSFNGVGAGDVTSPSDLSCAESGLIGPSTVDTPLDHAPCYSALGTNNYCFALTGKTWTIIKTHFPELVPRIVTRGTVFSRMSPDQKQQLVQTLQSLGYCVAMCGDGANDCGALKAAHTGISLSEAESSVASPFTSREPNIECVVRVIREGRAALVTSFGIFKYMAAYSLTQFISVMILYNIDCNLTDIEFLYVDLFIITSFAFLIGKTDSFDGPLVSQPPQTSLVSLAPVVSLLGQLLLVMITQIISFCTVQLFPWFTPFVKNDESSNESYENYAVFTLSSLQYVILAVIFSKGPPYRKPLTSNWMLLACVLGITSFTLYLTIGPFEWLRAYFQLQLPPGFEFKVIVICLALINLILAAFHEFFICDYLLFHKLRKKLRNHKRWRKPYLNVESELKHDQTWPPLCSEFLATPDLLCIPSPSHSVLSATVTLIPQNLNSYASVRGNKIDMSNMNGNATVPRQLRQNGAAVPQATTKPALFTISTPNIHQQHPSETSSRDTSRSNSNYHTPAGSLYIEPDVINS
uniref:Cation-transporting ATPase n=2 Tax=Cacopsylla melanoneura TaxID=428564 RepID=A0A8D8V6R7_9HEMI